MRPSEFVYSKGETIMAFPNKSKHELKASLAGTVTLGDVTIPAQVAPAWLRARSLQMVLIPGTRSVAHLEENIASLTIQLDAQEQRALEESAEVASLPSFRP